MPPRDFLAAISSEQSDQRKKQAEQAHAFVRDHHIFFEEADTNEDLALSLDEFIAALPHRVRSTHSYDEIVGWFDSIDADGDGVVTSDEFFYWSMGAASMASGAGVIDVFRRYDANLDGKLDEQEFADACREMGFGDHAHALIRELPINDDRTIDYLQLVETVRERKGSPGSQGASHSMKQFLCAMAWNQVGDGELVDTSSWEVSGESPSALRQALQALCNAHSVRLSELLKTIDTSDDQAISLGEWVRGMQEKCGYVGEDAILEQIFYELDDDGSGLVHFEEVRAAPPLRPSPAP